MSARRLTLFSLVSLLGIAVLAISTVSAQPSRHVLDAQFNRGCIRFSPSTLRAGQRVDVSIRYITNNGDIRWDSSKGTHLKVNVDRHPSGTRNAQMEDFAPSAVKLKAPVNPGERCEIHYRAVVPNATGAYRLSFVMVDGSSYEFGDKVVLDVNVVN